MKKSKLHSLWCVISILLQVLLCVTCGVFLFQMYRLYMIPTRYFLIFAGLLVLLTGIACLLLIRPKVGKWQKKPPKTKQIIGCILSLVLIAGCSLGFYAVSTLNSTLSSITSTAKVQVLLEVYVRNDDPAQYIQDTTGYVFGLSAATEEADNQAMLEDLAQVLGATPQNRSYETAVATIDALYAGEVDAVILDSSYLAILDDVEGYSDFEDKVRLLHEHVVEKEVPKEPIFNRLPGVTLPNGSEETHPVVQDPSTTPFLLYISGNDARRQLLADGGSDVNILVTVNPVTKQVLMVNTPRDYYIVNPASGDKMDKLSHCGLKGIDNCIQAMTNLYGIPVDYYARINFSGFRTLVDAIGGITVNSPRSFPTTSGYYFYEGENVLNGDQALSFARERVNLPGGDNDRGKNQMRLIEAMIKKLSSGTILTNYSQIMESLEGMFSTSMSTKDIGKLVQLQLSEMPQWEIYSFAVTGDNGTDLCWAHGYYAYVMRPHQNMVDHASALMEKVLSGETITQDDLTVN